MASTSAPALPSVGSTYDSMNDFKAAMYRHCVASSKHITTMSSDSKRCYIQCHYRVDGCQFATYCRGSRKLRYRVRRVVATHTCRATHDEDAKVLARRIMGEKLEVLEETMNAEYRGASAEMAENSSNDEDEFESDEESSGDEGGGAASPSSFNAEPRKYPSLRHPRITSLVSKINKLAKSGPLELSVDHGFSSPSHTDVRIHATAAALQRGWATILRAKGLTAREKERGTAFSLRCTRAAVSLGADKDVCGAYIKIKQQKDGQWSVVELDERHDHPLGPRLTAYPSASEVRALRAGAKKRRVTAPTPKKRVRSPSLGSTLSSVSSDEEEGSSEVQEASEPRRRSPSSTLVGSSPPLLKASKLKSRVDYTFLPSLNRFMDAISTSTSVHACAPSLLEAGIDSLDKLVLLLSLSDKSMGRYLEEVGSRTGMGKLQQALLKKALRGRAGSA